MFRVVRNLQNRESEDRASRQANADSIAAPSAAICEKFSGGDAVQWMIALQQGACKDTTQANRGDSFNAGEAKARGFYTWLAQASGV